MDDDRGGVGDDCRLSLRGSASLNPGLISSLFGQPPPASAPPAPPRRLLISRPQRRVDALGQRFASYTIRTRLADGTELSTERRYTDFVALHSEIFVSLALPPALPVPAVPSLLAWFGVGTPREEQLQQYVDQLLAAGGNRRLLPTLISFCKLAPFVASGSPAAMCLAALPSAAPGQCLAMLRAHLGGSSDEVVTAALQRLRELSAASDGGAAMLVDAGGIELLCSVLRRAAGDVPTPPSSSRVRTVVDQLTSAPPSAVASRRSRARSEAYANGVNDGGGGSGGGVGGASERSRRVSSAVGAGGNAAASARFASLPPQAASDAVSALATLASSGWSRPMEVRDLLRRCGASELLTSVMAAHPQCHVMQAGCAALISALVAADPTSPPDVASHYDFEAVMLTCGAMQAHRAKFDVQWHGCSALHALGNRADALAEAIVRHEGVRLVCKAMSTYRNDAAARLHASACGVLAALADRAPSSRPLLSAFSAAPLIVQTLADFHTRTEGGAAVFVCGTRALLTLSDLPPSSELELTTTCLEDLASGATELHGGRPIVQGVACEALAALFRERLRLLAAGRLDLPALHRAAAAPRAARFVTGVLMEAHGAPIDADGAFAALSAAHALVQLQIAAGDAVRGALAAAAAAAPPSAPPALPEALLSAAELQSLEAAARRLLASVPLDDPAVRAIGRSVLAAFDHRPAAAAAVS